MVLDSGMLISNRYRIIKQIGVGGMAIVYKATDEKLDRDVTFKVLKEDFIEDEDFIIRFVTEARAAAQLSNHNIVNVYDVGNDGDINYIVMEYIEGFTLKDLICSKAPFTDEETVGIAVQIAMGLGHAHKHNIIHRDVKPENILITNIGGEGTVKVTDFGIAQATNSSTAPTDNMGSVHYFSPEQAKGEKADERSDIYSLGIVMYEMVTGKQPFEGDTPVALAMKHLKSPLPNIKEINPEVSDNLIAVIKKCTAKEPKNRYQTTDALIKDLRRVIGLSNLLKEQKDVKHIDNKGGETKQFPKPPAKDTYNAEEEEEKRRERNIIRAAIIAGVLLVLLIGVGTFLINDSINGPTVKVPDFIGMTYNEAASKAEKKGLVVEFEQVYKSEAEAGEVVEQSVEAGERVDRGSSITLMISVGENAVIVPEITDMTKSKAEQKLLDLNLEFGDVKYVHSSKPTGTVISQDPEAGEMVAVNSSVNIEVSQGDVSEEVTMPNLVNKTKEEAQEALDEIGLVGKFLEGYSDSVEKDHIIDQGIAEGTVVGVGSTITLTVSVGKSETTQETTEMLTSAPPIIDITDDEDDDENKIPTSSVDEDEPVKRSVSISVNPDFNNNSYGTSDGSDIYNVKVVANDGSGERVVVNQKYAISDFPFSINDDITDKTEYKVYINDTLLSSETK